MSHEPKPSLPFRRAGLKFSGAPPMPISSPLPEILIKNPLSGNSQSVIPSIGLYTDLPEDQHLTSPLHITDQTTTGSYTDISPSLSSSTSSVSAGYDNLIYTIDLPAPQSPTPKSSFLSNSNGGLMYSNSDIQPSAEPFDCETPVIVLPDSFDLSKPQFSLQSWLANQPIPQAGTQTTSLFSSTPAQYSDPIAPEGVRYASLLNQDNGNSKVSQDQLQPPEQVPPTSKSASPTHIKPPWLQQLTTSPTHQRSVSSDNSQYIVEKSNIYEADPNIYSSPEIIISEEEAEARARVRRRQRSLSNTPFKISKDFTDMFSTAQLLVIKGMVDQFQGDPHSFLNNLNQTLTREFMIRQTQIAVEKNWNKEYFKLLEMPDSESKFQQMRSLVQEFVYTSETYGRLIISEMYLPVAEKTIHPLKLGGIAGGHKFVCQGILFKFAVDMPLEQAGKTVWMYGGTESCNEFAMKSAKHELNGIISMTFQAANTIRVPLTATIDFRGFRLTCQALLPIGKNTLVYGSDDGGQTHNNHPQFREAMKEVCAGLNLKGHLFTPSGEDTRIVYGPVDLEGHLVGEKTMYAVDLARLYPPEAPNLSISIKKRGHFFRMLRPELVKKFDKPLSSDAFTAFGKDDNAQNNIEVEEATLFLQNVVIPQFADAMSSKYFLKYINDGANLVRELHIAGINLRYLGVLRTKLSTSNVEGRALLLQEMILRCIKNMFRRKLRRSLKETRYASDAAYAEVSLELVNLLVGFDESSTVFWKSTIKEALIELYAKGLTDHELNPSKSLRKGIKMQPFLDRFQVLTGVKLTEHAGTYNKSKSERILFTDLVSTQATITKHMQMIDYAEGALLIFLSERKADKNEKLRLLTLAESKLHMAHGIAGGLTVFQLALIYYQRYKLASETEFTDIFYAITYYTQVLEATQDETKIGISYMRILELYNLYVFNSVWLQKKLFAKPAVQSMTGSSSESLIFSLPQFSLSTSRILKHAMSTHTLGISIHTGLTPTMYSVFLKHCGILFQKIDELKQKESISYAKSLIKEACEQQGHRLRFMFQIAAYSTFVQNWLMHYLCRRDRISVPHCPQLFVGKENSGFYRFLSALQSFTPKIKKNKKRHSKSHHHHHRHHSSHSNSQLSIDHLSLHSSSPIDISSSSGIKNSSSSGSSPTASPIASSPLSSEGPDDERNTNISPRSTSTSRPPPLPPKPANNISLRTPNNKLTTISETFSESAPSIFSSGSSGRSHPILETQRNSNLTNTSATTSTSSNNTASTSTTTPSSSPNPNIPLYPSNLNAHLPNCKYLDFTDCPSLTSTVLNAILSETPYLRELILDDCCKVSDKIAQILAPISNKRGPIFLHHLSLANCVKLTDDAFLKMVGEISEQKSFNFQALSSVNAGSGIRSSGYSDRPSSAAAILDRLGQPTTFSSSFNELRSSAIKKWNKAAALATTAFHAVKESEFIATKTSGTSSAHSSVSLPTTPVPSSQESSLGKPPPIPKRLSTDYTQHSPKPRSDLATSAIIPSVSPTIHVTPLVSSAPQQQKHSSVHINSSRDTSKSNNSNESSGEYEEHLENNLNISPNKDDSVEIQAPIPLNNSFPSSFTNSGTQLSISPSSSSSSIFNTSNSVVYVNILTELQTLNLQGCRQLTDLTLQMVCKAAPLLTYLNISCTKASNLTPLYQLSNLRHLSIAESNVELKTIQSYVLQDVFIHLEYLNFAGLGFPDEVFVNLSTHIQLKTLYMSDNTVGPKTMRKLLRYAPGLTDLDIGTWSDAPNDRELIVGLAEAFRELTRFKIVNVQSGINGSVISMQKEKLPIKHLELPYCAIREMVLHGLGVSFPLLQTLDLSGLSQITTAHLEKIKACTHLTSLNLSWCTSLVDSTVLEICSACPQLTFLSVAHCLQVTETAISKLPSKLTSLDISNCNNLLAIPANLRLQCMSLKSIGLAESVIPENSLQNLFGAGMSLSAINMKKCKQVSSRLISRLARYSPLLTKATLDECINVDENALTSLLADCAFLQRVTLTGVLAVSDCVFIRATRASGLRNLKVLNVSGCKNLSDETLFALAQNCVLISELNLNGCKYITSRGIIEIANSCKILLILSIFGCKYVTEEILDHLVEKCKVLHKLCGLQGASTIIKKYPFALE